MTISSLASMTGTEGQLFFHMGGALNTGLGEDQIQHFLSVLGAKAGKEEAEKAGKVFTMVLSKR